MSYKILIDLVIQREMGIIGRHKTLEVVKDVGISTDDTGETLENDHTFQINDLEKLMTRFNEKYGPVAVMGCKIAVARKAREQSLQLPPILR
ncbi:MAG: hypothetical protein HY751_03565 [Nitrospinae bacterium]|nr:hypothetical protein [Nitrospinota bacterium]